MKHLRMLSKLLFLVPITYSLALFSPAVAGTKVAFTGDQGTDENARAVLNMIANEGVDLVMIQGDLGYDPFAAEKWEKNLNDSLGRDFPVLTVVGNHENHEWGRYHQHIKSRIDRASELQCSGNPGVKAHCQFRNIEMIQVSPGIREIEGVKAEDNYPDYISDKFSGSSNKWRICSWHKNQADMQTGQKNNSTGWDVYRRCLDAGAIIAVAHEHAYSRTHLLSSFENKSVVHRNSDMTIEPGRSFMFVSGLGGRSVRAQTRGGDWWGSIYTASQGATHGALICDFEQNTAQCQFKAIDGSVPDQFTLRLNSSGEPVAENNVQASVAQPIQSASPVPQEPIRLPVVFKRTDRDEMRWIDQDVSGQIGSVWIDAACAEALGGHDLSGDWDALIKLAPGTDSIDSPCSFDSTFAPPPSSSQASVGDGYVFRRTDKDELRWIGKAANGELGSVRIDDNCAASLGGASRSGDWFDLVEAGPAFDGVANPCDGNVATVSSSRPSVATPSASDYVFARTDKDEMRWIGKTSSGEFGSVRINKTCAANLGGASDSGDWQDLMDLAPILDGVQNPCNDDDQFNGSTASSNSGSNVPSSGFVFKRSDNGELRWIAQDSSGQMGSVRINSTCAQKLGNPAASGDWFQLLELAPGFDSIPIPSRCLN